MASARVGVSLALTGPEARYARQLRHALELACDDERTRDGLSIDLIVEDDCASVHRAVSAAERLVSQNPSAVIGPMNSWTCEVQGPILAAAGLLHVTPSASNPTLTHRGWPGFFRMCPSDEAQAIVLAWTAGELARSHCVAAVHDGTAFAEPLAFAFLERCRQSGLVGDLSVAVGPDDPTSFSRAADQIAAKAPDAVFIVGLEEPCRHAAVAIRHAGSRAVFLGTDAIKPTLALVTPEAPDGPYLANASTDSSKTAPEFHRRFQACFGPHDSIYTVEAYDALSTAAAAIRRAETPTRQAVLAAMRSLPPINGLSGPIQFDTAGERVAPQLGVYRWDGSSLRFVCTQAATA